MILANISNGLVYPHDGVCYFQSNFGHSAKLGYFRLDSMPLFGAIHLLRGGTVEIVDATAHNKPLTDALRYGVPTWCLVFNRAGRDYRTKVCEWQTWDMVRIARSALHKQTAQTIRKLIKVYGWSGSLTIGRNVKLRCERLAKHDDKPDMIAREVALNELTAEAQRAGMY